MIVYSSTKHDFLKDVSERSIGDVIFNCVKEKLGRATGNSEKQSRENSLKEMYFIMTDNDIPDDSGVHIEYNIPGSSKRIDFVITGEDESHEECAIIIELKQWSEIEVTDKDAVVITYFKGGKQETNHPSYQAWSYSELLRSFNSTVYEENIGLQPCAYLHNYLDDGKIKDEFYSDYIKIAPLFLKNEKEKLRDFIKKYVKYGDKKQLMYRIDKGEIRPSKVLADSLASMLKGNQEFIMIDDQKIVYETALSMMRKSKHQTKKTS